MLALVAATIVVLLISGAVAVDISSMERQGQSLQNTADAAALAGVAAWVETGDEAAATEVVNDLIRQNGIEVTDGVRLDIQFPNSTTIEVDLVDGEPDRFLAGMAGLGGDLARDATAQLETCDDGCNRIIPVPEPFTPILTRGTGDGYIPIPMGTRLYAVNHHSYTIECLDRDEVAMCWQERRLFSGQTHTFNMHHPYVDGTKIYYLGWEDQNNSITTRPVSSGHLVLGCFDTATDTRCAGTAKMYNAGFGTMVGTEDGILIFAGDRKVYCFEPETFRTCPGYRGGRNSALAYQSGWGQWWENRAWNMDRRIHDGKVYVGLSKRYGGVYLHCWDIQRKNPCRDFGVVLANDSTVGPWHNDWVTGKLFFFRDESGEPQSLCSLGHPVLLNCWHLSNGGRDYSAEADMRSLTSQIGGVEGYLGRTTYHPPSNKIFVVGDYYASDTHCYDFSTKSTCGMIHTDTPWGITRSYGYMTEGNCLIGLGHESIFHSLNLDLTGECDGGSRTVRITPCVCGDEIKWPPIAAANLEGVGNFGIRVQDPDGNVLIPVDGDGWVNLLENPLNLDDIDTTIPYLILELAVDPDDSGIDPWANNPPSLLIGISDKDPRLVE